MPQISFVFPGQGSQYTGMGKKLCEEHQIARDIFNEVSETINIDIANMCFNSAEEELLKTENAQPAVLAVSVAMFRVYMEQSDVNPLFLAGHSLGEISALVCAGALKLSDAAKLAHKRGKWMQEVLHEEGAMAAIIGIESKSIEKECEKVLKEGKSVIVSNYNSLEQNIISGDRVAVEQVSSRLAVLGASVIPLQTKIPFHTPLMKPVAHKLEEELKGYKFSPMLWPVLSNVTALPYHNESIIPEMLSKHVEMPVRWMDIINYMIQNGTDMVIELGPKSVLKNLCNKSWISVKAYSFEKDYELLKNNSSCINEDSLNILKRCLAFMVCTPNNNWNNDEYMGGVIEPYNELKNMIQILEESGKAPTAKQINWTIGALKLVFETKKANISEQNNRFDQLYMETGFKIDSK